MKEYDDYSLQKNAANDNQAYHKVSKVSCKDEEKEYEEDFLSGLLGPC